MGKEIFFGEIENQARFGFYEAGPNNKLYVVLPNGELLKFNDDVVAGSSLLFYYQFTACHFFRNYWLATACSLKLKKANSVV